MAGSGEIFSAAGPSRTTVDLGITDEFELIERERMKSHVRPFGPLMCRRKAERTFALRHRRQRTQRGADLFGLHAARETDGSKVVPVQPLGQATQDRLVGIGGDPLDNQLLTRDAEGKRCAILQQPVRAKGHRRRGWPERWMTARVHCVFVQRYRQLDQEFPEIARQRDTFGLGGRVVHCVEDSIKRVDDLSDS